MNSAQGLKRCVLAAGLLAAIGCGSGVEPRVTFGNASGPIGKWALVSSARDAAMDDGDEVVVDAGRDAGAPPSDAADAGEPVHTPEPEPPKSAAISSLTFEAMTAPAGLKYQPKNIGAIWIADGSGKLVKSLEVWAATRVRYLTEYGKARGGSSVDVSARATLPSHRMHQVSWDLKDKSGAPVPEGTYKLVLELTDGDATGKTTSIAFDTSAGATTLTPADAACYKGMKLQLK